jgi:hypothetical protein
MGELPTPSSPDQISTSLAIRVSGLAAREPVHEVIDG